MDTQTFWPSSTYYSEAVQNPRLNFQDKDLANGKAHSNAVGPIPWSGGFVVVFQIRNGRKNWAVRCFTKRVQDQSERYAALSKHLKNGNRPTSFVDFLFIDEGIKINGIWYPIVKMPWVSGIYLDEYIQQLVHKRDTEGLRETAENFRQLVKELETCQVGHGDLQHGNILVDKEIKLVDYDGVFVPSLLGKQSLEVGHKHYQHPKRDNQFYQHGIDRFAALSIYTSLLALSVDPSLWQKFHKDDYLILNQYDYIVPQKSKLLNSLQQNTNKSVRGLSSLLIDMCLDKPHSLPPLEKLLRKVKHSSTHLTSQQSRVLREPHPKYRYPRPSLSSKRFATRASIVVSRDVCAGLQCSQSLAVVSSYYWAKDINELIGQQAKFCSEKCINDFRTQAICSECHQLISEKYWIDLQINKVFEFEKRFCCKSCQFKFYNERICAECGRRLPEKYWYSKEVDKCYGYTRRFCSQRCLRIFREKNLCAYCGGAFTKQKWHDNAIDLAYNSKKLFCSEGCAEEFKRRHLCRECQRKLSESFWTSNEINSAYGQETRFCAKQCIVQHRDNHLCAQCNGSFTKEVWQNQCINAVLGKDIKFCSEECAIMYQRRKICIYCGDRIPVIDGSTTYFYHEDIDRKLGYRGRFCSRECVSGYLKRK